MVSALSVRECDAIRGKDGGIDERASSGKNGEEVGDSIEA